MKIQFNHYFNPNVFPSETDNKYKARQAWNELVKKTYEDRRPHALEPKRKKSLSLYKTTPKVVTKATLEDGRVGYAWCSMKEKHWNRKLGNRIALSRAEAKPVPENDQSS